MKYNVSLQVVPNVPGAELYPLVDKVIEYIKESGVTFEVGPMETTMEGELPVLLDIVAKAQEICLENGATRILTVVKIDCKAGGVTIEEKVRNYR
ncbi:MAG: hypothetical protein BWY80_01273 [Firmicutes bacterium ADurb.Bin456]|nr:MAG: hypothetical protein BWY80_01273 [Firmicutes bacterium ADurb.Bin456]